MRDSDRSVGTPQPGGDDRRSNWLLTAIAVMFVALTFWPVFFVGTKVVNLQNRPLTPFPQTELASPDYYLQIGQWVEDRFPFKYLFVDLYGRILVNVFNTSTTPDVIVTDVAGWYDHRDSILLPCGRDYIFQELMQAADAAGRTAETAGKRFIFAMGPQKPTIYPERLPDGWAARYTCALQKLGSFRALINANQHSYILDTWEPFFELKERNPSTLLSIPQDSHWSSDGSLLFAKQLIETLSPGLWKTAEVKRVEKLFYGDLTRKLGIWDRRPLPLAFVSRAGVKTDRIASFRAGKNVIRSYESTGSGQLLPRTVILHDSYGLSLFRQLPPFFKRLDFVHFGAVESDPARRILAEAEIVVVLTAERFGYATLSNINDLPYMRILSQLADQAAPPS